MKYPSKIDELKSMAAYFGAGVYDISRGVIEDPQFQVWSGASRPELHHYGGGGLQYHTWEVAKLCLHNAELFDVSKMMLFFAALFHDTGKVNDYEFDPVKGLWGSTEHKYKIHHISRSALNWSQAIKGTDFEHMHDDVFHCILAHHGRREWGSPVEPQTKEAWLLHLCDGISARLDDTK